MPNVQLIVFLSLVLDLFAFTIPLPLFPRLVEWYTVRESGDPNGFLSWTLYVVSYIRGLFYNPAAHSNRWDVVLLGGLMGSVFSTLQFFVAPYIGSLSDRYGRKRILLITMAGNILSAVLWVQSTTFASYMLSRVVGGLSEGNVQLAIAILSDITTAETRSRALAQVGIAFAICFCIGPPIGAYFASRPAPPATRTWGVELNVYAVPAALTVVLLVLETIFLAVALPETRGRKLESSTDKNNTPSATSSGAAANGEQELKKRPGAAEKTATPISEKSGSSVHKQGTVQERLARLRAAQRLHFFFLCIFSGAEYTLTFLTFDLLDWNNRQNGALIGSIGVVSALLQGGYVRRAMSKVGEGRMAKRGIHACTAGLLLLSLLPHFVSADQQGTSAGAMRVLQGAALCFAFTSATVVNSLTALASLQCDDATEDDKNSTTSNSQLAKGKALGRFRSSGQLGRAIGPLLACASYWTFGPSMTYLVSAIGMLAVSILVV